MDAVKPVGLGARDSLRLEAGLPLYGHDLDAATNPVEADLAFALSNRRREEANFPGAARILGQLTDGSARKRVGLRSAEHTSELQSLMRKSYAVFCLENKHMTTHVS